MENTAVRIDFRDLADVAERLKANTDQLNLQLKTIEDRLNALSLGVEAWVTKFPLQQEYSREGARLTTNALIHGTGLNPKMGTFSDETVRPWGWRRIRTAVELGYARFPDGWKLAVRTVNYTQTKVEVGQADWEEPKDSAGVEIFRDVKPLLRASRTVRTLAVDRIPDLLATIFDTAMDMTAAVEKARRISESLQ